MSVSLCLCCRGSIYRAKNVCNTYVFVFGCEAVSLGISVILFWGSGSHSLHEAKGVIPPEVIRIETSCRRHVSRIVPCKNNILIFLPVLLRSSFPEIMQSVAYTRLLTFISFFVFSRNACVYYSNYSV